MKTFFKTLDYHFAPRVLRLIMQHFHRESVQNGFITKKRVFSVTTLFTYLLFIYLFLKKIDLMYQVSKTS